MKMFLLTPWLEDTYLVKEIGALVSTVTIHWRIAYMLKSKLFSKHASPDYWNVNNFFIFDKETG